MSESARQEPALLIPKRVTIETVFGCNAHCPMCPIDAPTARKKGMMPIALFGKIIDWLAPYREHIGMMDFFSLGEPMLDPKLSERIRYAKAKGFRNLGISTNVDLLTAEKARLILESGIDNIILSIDGVKKETHETIRPGVIFERVVANAEQAIAIRNAHNFKTRFVVRFIRQDLNRSEWQAYKSFWGARISKERGDFVTAYEVHACEPTALTKDSVLKSGRIEAIEKKPCPLISDVLNILADGRVVLCAEDWLHGAYNFGNAGERSPIEIFNSSKFAAIRAVHAVGEKNQFPICQTCTILYSSETKEIV